MPAKCPKCGAKVLLFQQRCPECGEQIPKVRDVLSKAWGAPIERSRFEQFALIVAGILSLLQCIVAVCVGLYLLVAGDGREKVLALILTPVSFIYAFALYVVFKRAYEL